MSHQAQVTFCREIAKLFPEAFRKRRVLDIGSLDINGNNRALFVDCEYVGVDLAPGKGVDKVCPGHMLDYQNGWFGTIICTECLEHDMWWRETVSNAVRMLEGGGLLLMTCATTGRGEHGTMSCHPECAPLLTGAWAAYYRNLTPHDLDGLQALEQLVPRQYRVVGEDLQFWGIKRV